MNVLNMQTDVTTPADQVITDWSRINRDELAKWEAKGCQFTAMDLGGEGDVSTCQIQIPASFPHFDLMILVRDIEEIFVEGLATDLGYDCAENGELIITVNSH